MIREILIPLFSVGEPEPGAGSRNFLQGAGVVKPYLVGARAGAGSQAPGLARAGASKRNLLKRLQGAGSQAFFKGSWSR